jgi:hypothetical protein
MKPTIYGVLPSELCQFLTNEVNENLLEFKFKRGENSISELSPLYQDSDIVIHNKSLSNGEEDISFSSAKNDNFCKEFDDLETHLSTYKKRG